MPLLQHQYFKIFNTCTVLTTITTIEKQSHITACSFMAVSCQLQRNTSISFTYRLTSERVCSTITTGVPTLSLVYFNYFYLSISLQDQQLSEFCFRYNAQSISLLTKFACLLRCCFSYLFFYCIHIFFIFISTSFFKTI